MANGVVTRDRRTRRRVRVAVQRPPALPRREHIRAAEADVRREASRSLVDEVLDLVLADVRRGDSVALLVRRTDDRRAQPWQEVHGRTTRGAQLGKAHATWGEVAWQHDVAARGGSHGLLSLGVVHLAHGVEEGARGQHDRLCLHCELLTSHFVDALNARDCRTLGPAIHKASHLDVVGNRGALQGRGEGDGRTSACIVVHCLAVHG
mmetsp:Transcript_33233/g.87403  ORF Transcript_33233/g.87403 Transcript_33233/m.87403 type:complete len:207 (+) Transcript_33233:1403-2023(+)